MLSCSLISAILIVLISILIYAKLGMYDGKPTGDDIPPEAIPIYANSDLTYGNRFFEYIFPLMVPVGRMIPCPIRKPDVECMSKSRDALRGLDEMGWKKLVPNQYQEEVVRINNRPKDDHVVDDMKTSSGNSGGGRSGDYGNTKEGKNDETLEVILLRPTPTNASDPASTFVKNPPLIVWFHGGGFTVGNGRDSYIGGYIKTIQKHTNTADTESSSSSSSSGGNNNAIQDAIWASVDYRLAPEHPFPAAPDDGLRALEYLLLEYQSSTEEEGGNRQRLGSGGVHIAGPSAGGTLAATVTLWALKKGIRVDSILLDSPAFPTNSCPMNDFMNGHCSVLNSTSYRWNAFTRIPPMHWVDWCVHAYTGCPFLNDNVEEVEEEVVEGCKEKFDFTGGALSVDEWRKAKAMTPDGKLPPLIVLTCKGDMLRDGANPFMEAYTEAAGGKDVVKLYHVDASSSHAGAFSFDPDAAKRVVDVWSDIIRDTADRD